MYVARRLRIVAPARSTIYSRVPGHINWQIETAAWNLAGFLHCALKPRWQQFGQFLKDFFNDFLNDFLYENFKLRFSVL